MSNSKIRVVSNSKKKEINQQGLPRTLNFLNENHMLTFEKRLIDTDIFYIKGSEIGNSERYNRGKTIHTINVWWARRPLCTMRVLIYASLIDVYNAETTNLFEELSRSIILPEKLYKKTQNLLRNHQETPKILDPFGGNGTIAFEASNLGLEAYSIDINEHAYFIQKSLLDYGFTFKEEKTNSLLKKHGKNILLKLHEETNEFFPFRSKNYTNYLWTYQTTCAKCKLKYSLSKRNYLSRKKKSDMNIPLGISYTYKCDREAYEIVKVTNKEHMKKNNWKNSLSVCPFCKYTNKISFKTVEDKNIIGIKLKDRSGKEFIKSAGELIPDSESLTKRIDQIVEKYKLNLPSSLIEKWSGIVNPGIYGMETHQEIFNQRQKLVMVTLLSIMVDEFQLIASETTTETALYIISLLTGLIDQLVDWNCRLSIWIPENEQVGRAFCGPGIPMLWDYSEIDPVLKGPANLWDKLERIINSKKSFVEGSIKPKVINARAQDLPFDDSYFDVIITDPPYYDNIYYSVLSNFFYSWKKVIMEKIEPNLFSKSITTSEGELVSSTYRNNDANTAHIKYVADFSKSIGEIERVCKENGIFALIYGHSAIEGWLPILESFRASSFYITSVQPLRIERIHRPRSMRSNASNSVVVIVARKFTKIKNELKLSEFEKKISLVCANYIKPLQQAKWSTFEIGIPVFANCIGLLSNHSSIIDESGKFLHINDLLKMINNTIQIYLPDFKIKNRKSL